MDRKKLRATIVLASILTYFVTTNSNAVTIVPSDYIIAGNIGDTWDYKRLDNSLFTWTLSEVTSGPFAGLLERGNPDSGMVYDLMGNELTIYEADKVALDPPMVIREMELGDIATYDDDPNNPTMYLFWEVPSITVEAGTFNDVLAWVFLDGAFSANTANDLLGLDPLVTAAVTDIGFYAQGVGEVAFVGIEAATGDIDGGHELVSTTVPTPATLPLLISGLLGMLLFRRKA